MTRATIKDIARHAGVSFKTVSRVINKLPSVNPELRARVEAALAELDYRPNLGARQMGGGRSFSLALLVTSRELVGAMDSNHRMPSYVSDVMTGMLQACNREDYHLVIDNVESFECTPGERSLARFIDLVAPDGLVLIPPLSDIDWVLDLAAARGIACARINPGTRLDQGFCIGIDNHAAGREVGELLLARGHRHIGYIGGPASHPAHLGRIEGLRAALADHPGVVIEERPGDFLAETGRIQALDLLSESARPTAITRRPARRSARTRRTSSPNAN